MLPRVPRRRQRSCFSSETDKKSAGSDKGPSSQSLGGAVGPEARDADPAISPVASDVRRPMGAREWICKAARTTRPLKSSAFWAPHLIGGGECDADPRQCPITDSLCGLRTPPPRHAAKEPASGTAGSAVRPSARAILSASAGAPGARERALPDPFRQRPSPRVPQNPTDAPPDPLAPLARAREAATLTLAPTLRYLANPGTQLPV